MRLEDLKTTNPVSVGDKVEIEIEKSGTGIINQILPRKNYIIRQSPKKKTMLHMVAANVD